jgi:hypothetical protein
MAVRPYIRTFDSNDYWHQLAVQGCMSFRSPGRATTGGPAARPGGRHGRPSGLYVAQGRLEHHLQCHAHSGIGAASRGGAQIPQFHSGPEGHCRRSPTTFTTATTTSLRVPTWTSRSSTINRCTRRRPCGRACICRPSSNRTMNGRARASGRASKRGSKGALAALTRPSSRGTVFGAPKGRAGPDFAGLFQRFCDLEQSSEKLEMLTCGPI